MLKYLYIYLVVINILAVILTIYDKSAAVHDRWRVRERTLMLVSALGGAVGMFLTMLIIRHKTRKPLFMIGIPVIFILELIAAYLVARYVFGIL
ncbi:MAG: DUF1294 domain-containing protein [Ruminococcus sp.]|nr:DUF1294 domain-containing protein [Ruminococcus sp.]